MVIEVIVAARAAATVECSNQKSRGGMRDKREQTLSNSELNWTPVSYLSLIRAFCSSSPDWKCCCCCKWSYYELLPSHHVLPLFTTQCAVHQSVVALIRRENEGDSLNNQANCAFVFSQFIQATSVRQWVRFNWQHFWSVQCSTGLPVPLQSLFSLRSHQQQPTANDIFK